MTPHTRILAAGILILACGSVASQPPTEYGYTAIKSMVEGAIEADPRRSEVYVKVEGGKLYYLPEQLEIKLPASLPVTVRLAITAQFKAEVLRKHAGKNQKAIESIKKLEQVAEQLTTGKKGAKAGVGSSKVLSDEVLARIAEGKGANGGVVAGKTPLDQMKEKTGEIRRYQVTLELKPANGTGYYISALEWHILSKFGKEHDLTAWYQAADNKAFLYGLYYFAGKWEEKTKETSKIEITRNMTVSVGRE